MTDEEMENILEEYRQKQGRGKEKIEDKEKKGWADRWDEKVENSDKYIFAIFDYLENTKNPLIRIPCKLHEKTWNGIRNYANKHKVSPYTLNTLFMLKRIVYANIAILIFVSFIELLVSGVLINSEVIDSYKFFSLLFLGAFLVMFLSSRAAPLYYLDRLSGSKCCTEFVELRVVRYYSIVPADIYRDSYLDFFFVGGPYPSYYYYFPLSQDHKPKSSSNKKQPKFYDDNWQPIGKEKKKVRFIMTLEKSDLIDALAALEPTMEFEVTYLRFSKILKEIRPIEGYEYAEGVEEILNKINTMYP